MTFAIVAMGRARAMLDGVGMRLHPGAGMPQGLGCHGVRHPAAQGQQKDDQDQEPVAHGGG